MTQGTEADSPQTWMHRIRAWIATLDRQIWILAAGQLLLFLGQGFTLVYGSIYFVNQLGFSTTQVGFALSASAISGVLGRFIAGNTADSRWMGRKGTLMVAAAISALASLCLGLTQDLSLLVIGNLLMGLGIGLYWPSTLAVITDLTTAETRPDAFAVIRLTDSLGLSLGALLAGQFIALSGNYRALFFTKGAAYLIFMLIILWAISETYTPAPEESHPSKPIGGSWFQALGDRVLLIWLVANVFFTTYEAQIEGTMPMYLANFVPGAGEGSGFGAETISLFFFAYVLLKTMLQLPIARLVKSLNYTTALSISLVLWGAGFVLIWVTGVVSTAAVIPALGAFVLVAVAEVIYLPCSSSLVGDMAPESIRGVYFSLASQCWAIGFFIGPAMGGWALDHPQQLGSTFWLWVALSITLCGAILWILRGKLQDRDLISPVDLPLEG